jgi:biotin operon repressor
MSDPRQQARSEVNLHKTNAVLSVIKERNSANPVTGKTIAYKCGLTSDVSVRRAVNQLRQEGEAICSNGDGYFYAANNAELQDTIVELESRVSSVNNAIVGLRLASDRMTRESPDLSILFADFTQDYDIDAILNAAE